MRHKHFEISCKLCGGTGLMPKPGRYLGVTVCENCFGDGVKKMTVAQLIELRERERSVACSE